MNDKFQSYVIRELAEYQAIIQIVITRRANRRCCEVCRAILRNSGAIQPSTE